jgi:hypothetical protein
MAYYPSQKVNRSTYKQTSYYGTSRFFFTRHALICLPCDPSPEAYMGYILMDLPGD